MPTAIAGVYGMTFDHMPELHWIFGYPLALTAMPIVCYIVYRKLKGNGWL